MHNLILFVRTLLHRLSCFFFTTFLFSINAVAGEAHSVLVSLFFNN